MHPEVEVSPSTIARFLVAVSFLLAGSPFSAAQDVPWKDAIGAAERLYRNGEFGSVEKALLAKLKQAESEPRDPRTEWVLTTSLGTICHDQARYDEAETYYRRAAAIARSVSGADNTLLALSLNNLTALYVDLRQYSRAERTGLSSVAAELQSARPGDPWLPTLFNTLGALANVRRRYADAEHWYNNALAICEKLGPLSVETMQALDNLSALYWETGRISKALAASERALAIAEETLAPQHPVRARLLLALGRLHFTAGRLAQAEGCYRQALAIAENKLGPEHPVVGQILQRYAETLRHMKRKPQARQCEQRARAILQAASSRDPGRHIVDLGDLRK